MKALKTLANEFSSPDPSAKTMIAFITLMIVISVVLWFWLGK
jgi:hypothetical protein